MRIVSHGASHTADVNPCETEFSEGEFEDYTIKVTSTLSNSCSVIAPWHEDFENGSNGNILIDDLSCWSQEYVSSVNNWKLVNTNGNLSIQPRSGALMAEFRVSSYNSKTKLVSPAIDMRNLNTPQLTFYFANVTWWPDIDQLRVYYKKNASDVNWTLIPNAEYTTEHASWEKVELILPEAIGATDYVIAFEAESRWARGLNLDDISVHEAPTCPAPIALVGTGMTSTTATIEWTEGGNESNWNISWGTPGYSPSTALATANETSYSITGLNADTNYDIICSSRLWRRRIKYLGRPFTDFYRLLYAKFFSRS